MKFDPKMIHMTPDAIESGSHHCMYKSLNEYVVCDFFERDDFIARGFKVNPSEFLEEAKVIDYKLMTLDTAIVAIDNELAELQELKEVKVKKKRATKVMEDEGPKPGDDVITNEFLI